MKLPRDLGGRELAELLRKLGYKVIRQTGSHMRLTAMVLGAEVHVTVPAHSPLKVGTVGRILNENRKGFVYDYSRDGILRSIEHSLKRLKLDRIDIALIHDPDADRVDHEKEAIDITFPALAELRSQGVIKAIGAGMNQWKMLERFVRHADPDVFLLAGRYTF